MRIDCNKLLNARLSKGLKLGEAAKLIGIPPTILRKWEHGIGNSPFESGRLIYPIENILSVYDIRIEDLYYDIDIERLNKVYDYFDPELERQKYK